MANAEHVEIVKQDAEAMARCRKENSQTPFNLIKAELLNANLSGANLVETNLIGLNLGVPT